jgi:16S rRNA (cytosine967-C5)-methyltransferase
MPTTRTEKKAAKVSPARAAAFHILLELARSASAHSDDLLRSDRVNALSSQDRNLCTALVMGTLRWQLALDETIAPLLTHKSKLDEPVRTALRLAAFQLLFFDRIPAHAAISDSVELTKRAGHRFASGLVNAVLRKIAASSEAIKGHITAMSAHPDWLVQRWTKQFGPENAAAIFKYDQQLPPVHVRLPNPEAETALTAEGITLAASPFLNASRLVVAGDAANSNAVRNGLARIQDEGSQLIAELLGAQADAPAAILDCCAAPGGKTATLAERHASSRVVACDISAARLKKMEELFRPQPALAKIECRLADAALIDGSEQFDLILCDVPCSGTGTLARNPEIKLRLHPDDLSRQQARQVDILRAALKALAPAGRLLYSTCSLEPEEDEQVILAILKADPSVRVLPIQETIENLAADRILHEAGVALLLSQCIRGQFLRTIPGLVAVDGFFAAMLTKN